MSNEQYPYQRNTCRGHQLLRIVTFMFAVVGAMQWPGFADAGTVVTNNLISQSTQSQANIPITFGQVFKGGDVPTGETLAATLNGQPVQLQVDVKATNPDGSLRHAVLTALIPSIAGDVTEPLTISTASPSTSGSPVTLTQLLATNYDATASLNIGGTTYTADAKTLLQAASAANACKPWGQQCNVWLSGPLVSEWIVGGPVKTSGGTANPNLNVYFNVRAYASSPGTIAYVRTDIVVENDWAYTPQAQPQYTATLTSGSAAYTSPALTQYAYTRWHQILWWNDAAPQAYLQQDTQYIQDSLAVSRYMVLQPDDSFLSGVIQSCAPLDNCNQTKQMSTVGAQAGIGPLPQWTSTYIVDPDIRAYNWMLANTDALGTYGIHYRDQATGSPLSIQGHPYVTIIDWNSAYTIAQQSTSLGAKYRADLLPNCTNNSVVTNCTTAYYNTGDPYTWDNAHQPAEGYVAYMVTGSYYYMEELAYGASHNEIWSNETYRGLSQGLINASHSQTRGKAWVLREMANAAYLLPDAYPLKSEFNADVANSLADFNATFTNNSSANPFGIVGHEETTVQGAGTGGVPPWQQAFLTWSAGHAAELGFAGADAFRNWLANFQMGTMTDWMNNPNNGYCWLIASAYTLTVLDSSGNYLPSFSAIYSATYPNLSGLTCNSPTMISAVGTMTKQTWQAGEMLGYPNSATGFPANIQIGVAAAGDSSLPNAQTAWGTFQNRSVQPTPPNGYNDVPQFAVLPRFLPAVPIVNIYASPNPVTTAGSSTTLYWNASGATTCSAKWTSNTAASGQASVGPINGTVSYPISCTGSNGTTNASVSVSVAGATPAPPPTTSPTSDPPAPGKGGGSMGWLVLLVLAGLVGWSGPRTRRSRST